MLHKSGIGINAGESEGLTPELEAVKSLYTGLYHSSRNLRQRLSAVHKTVLEEVVQRFTSTIWHKEIEDIIVLKNNKGTEDNRVRKLDYSIQLSKLFYERFINDEDITLFSLTKYLNSTRQGHG